MDKKKLLVIGAGISGLSAAIYACNSGFDVTVLEKCHNPGGLSTSWKRKGYTIEGGIHWLTGSSEQLPHHKMWKAIGALCENNPIQLKDPLYTLIEKHRRIPLYRDPAKMADTLISIAPEDAKPIRKLERQIRALEHFHAPAKFGLRELARNILPALPVLPALLSKTIRDYVGQFKNASVRSLLSSFINPEQNAISLVYTLATFAVGDGGYPKGGSLVMSANVEKKLLSLGGRVLYGAEVSRVLVENGKVSGVNYGQDKFLPADAVIVSADARMAIDRLFEQPLQDAWAQKMRKEMEVDQCLIFSMGVKADLSSYPRNIAFPLDKDFEYAGCSCNVLMLNLYSGPDFAPEGCTTLTWLLFGEMYEYWKQAKSEGTYKEKKQEITSHVIELIQNYLPEVEGNIEFTDLATPLTLERYCSTYKGGFMSLWKAGKMPATAPVRYSRIAGLYFAGQRTDASGGLPVAVASGRKAVKCLCRDTGINFIK